MKNSIKGYLALLITTLIWGGAFVAQTAASDTVPSFAFNASRSFLATAFLAVFLFIRSRFPNQIKYDNRRQSVKGGIICGLSLFVATNLQQFGISAYPEGVAASGRSGFLTATYVVMVAVAVLFIRKKVAPIVIISAVLCLTGMYFLSLSGGIDNIYAADIPLFFCAIAFAVYIMIIDRFAYADPVLMSCIQFAIVTVLSAVSSVIFENCSLDSLLNAFFPIAFAGIFSSGIAYTLQIIGQKYIEPSAASIIMSLESVFAAFFGWIILGERLGAKELFGSSLVFISIILSQIPTIMNKNKAVMN